MAHERPYREGRERQQSQLQQVEADLRRVRKFREERQASDDA